MSTETKVILSSLRLGFLGVGWIGKNRMDFLTESGIARVAAVADVSREMAEAAAGDGSSLVFSSLDDLVSYGELDGIVIATPSALHASQVKAALDAGFPVFCQKPLGRNSGEVNAVIKSARERNLLLGVDMSYRFMEPVRIAKKLLGENVLGKVYALDTVFHNAYGPDKEWFYDPELSGGGCVIDLGIHLVDLALWFLDFPEVKEVKSALFCRGERIRGRGGRVEDYASVRMEVQGGVHINLGCSWKLSAGCDAVIGVTLYGTEGALSIKNVNGSFYDFTLEKYRGTSREILFTPPDLWGGRAIIDWASRLSLSRGYDSSLSEVLLVADVLDAIYNNS
ncbi:MAG: Gfo/Idh/MocA family oxidoreductase [Fibrobacter sp.]|jgi:predicted dehydrogenase|nr:Gfo/Idh/MocA family oxidoreductase [Fibrobacter sp.]